jgi:hypothetical protein
MSRILNFVSNIQNINRNYENNHRIVRNIIGNESDDPYSRLFSDFFTDIIAIAVTNYNIDEPIENENIYTSSVLTSENISINFSQFDEKSKEIHRQCSICIEDFCEESAIILTGCNHCYHEKCLTDWIVNKNNCPVCRKDF